MSLKVNLTKEWCEKMAALEGDHDVTVGSGLLICPRCLTPADHSPDDKVCSDHCITRHRETIRTLAAELEETRKDVLYHRDCRLKADAQLAALTPALRTLRETLEHLTVHKYLELTSATSGSSYSSAEFLKRSEVLAAASALLALVPEEPK